MRLLVPAILFLAGGCVRSTASSPETATLYYLEKLVNGEKKQPAPPEIVSQVVGLEREGLEDDRSQNLWSDKSQLLAVIPIHLNSDGVVDYLVYPARYLPTFYGAHAIACWVFKGGPGKTYALVLAGRHDAVRILPHRTNGLADIDLIYWSAAEEVTSFRYDGHHYREADRP